MELNFLKIIITLSLTHHIFTQSVSLDIEISKESLITVKCPLVDDALYYHAANEPILENTLFIRTFREGEFPILDDIILNTNESIHNNFYIDKFVCIIQLSSVDIIKNTNLNEQKSSNVFDFTEKSNSTSSNQHSGDKSKKEIVLSSETLYVDKPLDILEIDVLEPSMHQNKGFVKDKTPNYLYEAELQVKNVTIFGLDSKLFQTFQDKYKTVTRGIFKTDKSDRINNRLNETKTIVIYPKSERYERIVRDLLRDVRIVRRKDGNNVVEEDDVNHEKKEKFIPKIIRKLSRTKRKSSYCEHQNDNISCLCVDKEFGFYIGKEEFYMLDRNSYKTFKHANEGDEFYQKIMEKEISAYNKFCYEGDEDKFGVKTLFGFAMIISEEYPLK